MSDPEPLLDLRDVTVQFGGLKAVSGFNFSIRHGELTGLIGPNGAGKTTIFNLIRGRKEALSDYQTRHRPHFPEHPALRFHVRLR